MRSAGRTTNVASGIKFLPPTSTDRHELSKRGRELERADIKAHAAKISHQKRRQRREKEELELDLRKNLAVPELAILLCGSSDPFNAFPIRVTPQIHRLISYTRDVLLTTLTLPDYMRRLTLDSPRTVTFENSDRVIGGANYAAIMGMFHHATEGAVLAWLTGHIPGIVTAASEEVTHDLTIDGLKMKLQSIRLLRQDLSKYNKLSRDAKGLIRLHVRGLMESDCMALDRDSAKAHLKMLMQFDDPFGGDELSRATDTSVIMFNIVELASKGMERPLIPFGRWTHSRLASYWALCYPALPVHLPEYDEVHPCIQPPVREIMIRLRYCIGICDSPLPTNTAADKLRGSLVYGWIATRTQHDVGVLLHLFFDLIEGKTSTRTAGQQFTEAAICLTLAHCIRKSVLAAQMENSGIDIREASHAIMPRLATTLQSAFSVVAPDERPVYDEVYFWMFYVGAMFEERQKASKRPIWLRNKNGSSGLWFSKLLARHASNLGVRTWSDAKRILEKFVYDRHLQPEGHLWFEDVLSTSERQNDTESSTSDDSRLADDADNPMGSAEVRHEPTRLFPCTTDASGSQTLLVVDLKGQKSNPWLKSKELPHWRQLGC
ncbi:hypothetical protein H2202_001862 [Exophiala xenobiotica]|nr:hypothetical protein H2202_001862 [Exophiala xenobiotica]KAK5259446.1 hypothetical protein LTR40_005980 [Exophiala xenobiotica]KAK5325658.1 hypothetical protein LTR93_003878 [Exophiala xenobiotica]KAK5464414.1 hypothetical protein LTR20_005120 [Exophiala xenobiotica]KAK5498174.1 hypothetical protein LTR26_001574 [Exophiala xenobiotica]